MEIGARRYCVYIFLRPDHFISNSFNNDDRKWSQVQSFVMFDQSIPMTALQPYDASTKCYEDIIEERIATDTRITSLP